MIGGVELFKTWLVLGDETLDRYTEGNVIQVQYLYGYNFWAHQMSKEDEWLRVDRRLGGMLAIVTMVGGLMMLLPLLPFIPLPIGVAGLVLFSSGILGTGGAAFRLSRTARSWFFEERIAGHQNGVSGAALLHAVRSIDPVSWNELLAFRSIIAVANVLIAVGSKLSGGGGFGELIDFLFVAVLLLPTLIYLVGARTERAVKRYGFVIVCLTAAGWLPLAVNGGANVGTNSSFDLFHLPCHCTYCG